MKTAICPGSFDPITLGHLNIIRRVSRMFDEVVVCVMRNASKSSGMFSMEERCEMVRRSVARFPNVRVESPEGLLAEYVKSFINKKINPQMETLFLPSSEKYTFLSSSIVREMARYGADLTGFVPDEIKTDIEKKALLWRGK